MKKTITMYELLGMVKDGKAPKKIKYENREYYLYDNKSYLSTDKTRFFDRIYFCDLNIEVEILDEEEFEDIEEITIRDKTIGFPNGEWTARNMDKAFSIKINQLIKNQKKIIERINKEN